MDTNEMEEYEKEMEKYEMNMKMLQDEWLRFHSNNWFEYSDGMHVWNFSSSLEKMDVEDESYEYSNVVSQTMGIVIPSEITFSEDVPYVGFFSAWDLCDSISGDLLSAYCAVADRNGIREDIIKELGLYETDSFESEIAIIQDIKYTDVQYLKIYLDLFDEFKQGLPIRYCRLAVVLLNLEQESESVDVLLDAGWRLRPVGDRAVIAFRRI